MFHICFLVLVGINEAIIELNYFWVLLQFFMSFVTFGAFILLTVAKNTRMKGLEAAINNINATMQKMIEDADAHHNESMQHRHGDMA